jgi:DNA-binding beta-propeller fold protein YncE
MVLGKFWTVVAAAALLSAAAGDFRVPGLNYPALIRDDLSILPGGRVLRPFGRQVLTGTGPFAIAVSPNGRTIVTANIGISIATGVDRPSVTVISPGKRDEAWNLSDYPADPRQSRSQVWQGLTAGLVVTGTNTAWVSEGATGRIVELNLSTGTRKSSVSLNSDDYSASVSDALAFDADRNLLIALDSANNRAIIIDIRRGLVQAVAKTGALPTALALSEDGKHLYIANRGRAPDSPTMSIIDLTNPAEPKPSAELPLTGKAPFGLAVHGKEAYISMADTDTIAIVNVEAGKLDGEIALRIPGLEEYRGVTPLGLAFDSKSGRLLVAEAGINAVGVIDPQTRSLTGHLPVGWFPAAITVRNGQVYVASARGRGTGPSSPLHRVRMIGGNKALSFEMDTSVLRRGSVSAFMVPEGNELAHQSDVVMQANGFTSAGAAPPAIPAKTLPPVRYVVLVVKGNRSFDEILGDVDRAGGRVVLSEPSFAHFGSDGYVSGGKKRFSLHVDVTPNHHEMVKRWSFADNYYADSDSSAGTYRWLTGSRPDFQSESSLLYSEAGERNVPPAGKELWDHLSAHNIDWRRFGDDGPPDTRIPDQQRLDQFVTAIRKDYLDAGKPFPRFVMVRLPNDTGGTPRPEEGYAYEASYVADNDYALGRMVEFLSGTPWWREMAIFVTESGANGGADHVDSHRTVLLGAGPWFRTNYVSHTNASAPSLLRTVFKFLALPPMSLYDATAGDLLDMFGAVPDFEGYKAKPEDPRLFDPEKVAAR